MKRFKWDLMERIKTGGKSDFAVIGLGRFGTAVCETLYRYGHEVLAIDSDERKVNQIIADHLASQAMQLDVTELASLKEAGLVEFETVIVSLGGFIEASIIAVMSLKEAGVHRVIAKASSEMHEKLLHKVGADQVVFPEREMGFELARTLIKPRILDWLDIDKEHSIAEVIVPDSFFGKSLMDLQLRNKMGLNVIAIHQDDRFEVNPVPTMILEKGMAMVVIGQNKSIDTLAG